MSEPEVVTGEIMQSKRGAKPKPQRAEIVPATPMSLLDRALENQAGIDVIERLAALRDKEINRDAEIRFNIAMSEAQAEIGRVAPDLSNSQTSSRYASYAALDRVLRPIYTKHGFALSFDEADCPIAGSVRVLCYVSHTGGFMRTYRKDMPMPLTGPKGNAVMSTTHGAAAADSYGMRYILRKVFNVAIGDADTDGNAPLDGLDDMIKAIQEAPDLSALKTVFTESFNQAKLAKNLAAQGALVKAKDERKAQLTAEVPA